MQFQFDLHQLPHRNNSKHFQKTTDVYLLGIKQGHYVRASRTIKCGRSQESRINFLLIRLAPAQN